ncbi:MAG: hypothetical protein KZQ83_16780 [gamma proteobacterium symbiont of Taylorina sp.]|nr:hypothetical protein [gamma proteobacterium symbiont of Taylorina sp.]
MKDLILGCLIGGIIGLWFGVNLGKDQPLLTNPFVEKSDMVEISKKFKAMQKDVTQKSKELYKDAKTAVDYGSREYGSKSVVKETAVEDNPNQ